MITLLLDFMNALNNHALHHLLFIEWKLALRDTLGLNFFEEATLLEKQELRFNWLVRELFKLKNRMDALLVCVQGVYKKQKTPWSVLKL